MNRPISVLESDTQGREGQAAGGRDPGQRSPASRTVKMHLETEIEIDGEEPEERLHKTGYFTSHRKINPKWINDLNIRGKTTELRKTHRG